MIRLYWLLLLCGLSVTTHGQQNMDTITFNLTFNQKSLVLDQNYYLPNIKDSVNIEVLKFYISNVQFFQEEQLVGEAAKKYHFINLENPNTLHFTHSINQPFNHIQFNVGIDSTTNQSGVFGGDLDPTNGMYWTWKTGYINFKLEGTSAICPSRKNQFLFHVGGYQTPYNSLRQIRLIVPSKSNKIKIELPIDKLLEKFDLAKIYRIMSPSALTMLLADLIASQFKIVQ